MHARFVHCGHALHLQLLRSLRAKGRRARGARDRTARPGRSLLLIRGVIPWPKVHAHEQPQPRSVRRGGPARVLPAARPARGGCGRHPVSRRRARQQGPRRGGGAPAGPPRGAAAAAAAAAKAGARLLLIIVVLVVAAERVRARAAAAVRAAPAQQRLEEAPVQRLPARLRQGSQMRS